MNGTSRLSSRSTSSGENALEAEADASRAAVLQRFPVLFGRELIGPHHVAERAEVLLLVGVVGIALVLLAGYEGGFAPRLELDRVGPGLGGRVDELPAEVHVAVVVGAHLGHDVGRLVLADDGSAKLDGLHVLSSDGIHICCNER